MSVSILSKQIIKKQCYLIIYLKLITVFNSILLFIFNMHFATVYFQTIEWVWHCADANEQKSALGTFYTIYHFENELNDTLCVSTLVLCRFCRKNVSCVRNSGISSKIHRRVKWASNSGSFSENRKSWQPCNTWICFWFTARHQSRRCFHQCFYNDGWAIQSTTSLQKTCSNYPLNVLLWRMPEVTLEQWIQINKKWRSCQFLLFINTLLCTIITKG